jgi:hypothetical protein
MIPYNFNVHQHNLSAVYDHLHALYIFDLGWCNASSGVGVACLQVDVFILIASELNCMRNKQKKKEVFLIVCLINSNIPFDKLMMY